MLRVRQLEGGRAVVAFHGRRPSLIVVNIMPRRKALGLQSASVAELLTATQAWEHTAILPILTHVLVSCGSLVAPSSGYVREAREAAVPFPNWALRRGMSSHPHLGRVREGAPGSLLDAESGQQVHLLNHELMADSRSATRMM